ncbi:MAG: hypothetical protein AAGI37_20485 [Planctomycetota bacterium]
MPGLTRLVFNPYARRLAVLIAATLLSLPGYADPDNDAVPPQHAGHAGIDVIEGLGHDFTDFQLTPDAGHLIVLQPRKQRLVKVRLSDLEIVARSPKLADGLCCFILSTDGKRILTGSAPHGYQEHRESYNQRGVLQWLDLASLEPLGPASTIQTDIVGLQRLADGNIAAMSGSGAMRSDNGHWAILNETARGEVYRIGMHRFDRWYPFDDVYATTAGGRVVLSASTQHGGFGARYFADNETGAQGESFPIEGNPGTGGFSLIDDERFVVSYRGALLRVSNHPLTGLRNYGKTIHENKGAVASRELGVLALCVQGGIELYRWPGLEPMRHVPLAMDLEFPQAVGDLGVFFARQCITAENALMSADRLVRVDLSQLLSEEEARPAPPAPAPLHDDATGLPTVSARLALRGELKGLHLSADGQALLVFDADEGRVHRLDRGTLEIESSSEMLPYGSHDIAICPKKERIVVLCAPDQLPRHVGKPIAGLLIWLDAKTLKQVGQAQHCPVSPHLATFDKHGDLYVAGKYDDHDNWLILRSEQGNNQLKFFERGRGYSLLRFGPDGETLFTDGGNFTRVHGTDSGEIKKGKLPSTREAYMFGRLYFSNSANYIAAQSGGVIQFKNTTDQYGEPLGSVGQLTAMTGVPPLLAACTNKGALMLFEVPACRATAQVELGGIVTGLVYHPESDYAYGLYWPNRYLEDSRHDRYTGPYFADVIAIDLSALKQDHAIDQPNP